MSFRFVLAYLDIDDIKTHVLFLFLLLSLITIKNQFTVDFFIGYEKIEIFHAACLVGY